MHAQFPVWVPPAPAERTSPSSSCRAHFSKPLRLSRIACGDRRAAARQKGASLTAAAVWKFRRQEFDGEVRSASAACQFVGYPSAAVELATPAT
jgi:hypothetical protein